MGVTTSQAEPSPRDPQTLWSVVYPLQKGNTYLKPDGHDVTYEIENKLIFI